jgi:hypothetical protein
LHFSPVRISGILSVFNHINEAVSNYGKQLPPADIGVDAFEFWCPQRRPEGHNVALKINPGLMCFKAENIRNGIDRPVRQPNAWVADLKDTAPKLELTWKEAVTIQQVVIKFDTDFDHPMETVLMGHPESVMPFCVRTFTLRDEQGIIVYHKEDNYQTINRIVLDNPVHTRKLTLEVSHPEPNIPASVFEIQCYTL